MTYLKTVCFLGIALACAVLLPANRAYGQGTPVFVQHCVVPAKQHFKQLPMPGAFVANDCDALKVCASASITIIEIHQAKAGKAKSLKLQLTMQGDKLSRSVAMTHGAKNFEKLYAQLVSQVGRPTKMVESLGKRAYQWGLKSRFAGDVVLLYDPKTEDAEAIIGAGR
jgi:hypothetical protein